MQPIHGLGGHRQGGVEAERHVRAADVVVGRVENPPEWSRDAGGGAPAHRKDARYAARARTSASVSWSFGMWALGRCVDGSRSQRVR